jgi:hypothetical protein
VPGSARPRSWTVCFHLSSVIFRQRVRGVFVAGGRVYSKRTMPITWQISPRGHVDVLFTDPYSQAEAEKVMKQVFAEPGVPRPLRFVVDVRQSTPPDAEFVVNAITFWQMHVSEMWDAKIAIVAATERQAGMAEMTELSAESRDLPFTIRRFHESERAEADAWLHS